MPSCAVCRTRFSSEVSPASHGVTPTRMPNPAPSQSSHLRCMASIIRPGPVVDCNENAVLAVLFQRPAEAGAA